MPPQEDACGGDRGGACPAVPDSLPPSAAPAGAAVLPVLVAEAFCKDQLHFILAA